jgi:hypothetical protein
MTSASPSLRRPEARRAVAFFVQAAFAHLHADVERGDEVEYALDARSGLRGPALYDYRPLFRRYVERRLQQLTRLPDYAAAVAALADDPAIVAAARDGAPEASGDAEALRDAMLVPLLVGAAEGAGAFDFDDEVFERVWQRLLATVAEAQRAFTAFAPLVGATAPDVAFDLGDGVVLRRVEVDALADAWPESQGLLPDRFGIAADRRLALEIDVALPRGRAAEPPDAARRIARAVLALRLVHGGPVACGPCLFERVDWSPRAVRALPASVTQDLAGEPVRLEPSRAPLVRALVERVRDAEGSGGAVAVALSRWGAASAAHDAGDRAVGILQAIEPLLAPDGGGPWAVAMRAAALCGNGAGERELVAGALLAVQRIVRPGAPPVDAERVARVVDDCARVVLVAALEHGVDVGSLADLLDGVLLGARPRPQVVGGVQRAAA